jgi:death-on-curing protein
MPIDFLYLDDLAAIHRDQIERYGGEMGIRDVGLLESAAAQPRATFGGVPFPRGEEPPLPRRQQTHRSRCRAIVFLALNDVVLEADEAGLEAITLAVACGRADKKQVAEFFRKIAK